VKATLRLRTKVLGRGSRATHRRAAADPIGKRARSRRQPDRAFTLCRPSWFRSNARIGFFASVM